jgi:tetratricopeptide (TPR) repeat protein
MRGDLASARRRADELLQLGEARNDPIWRLMGCRLSGVSCFPLGEFTAAQHFLERGLELYDPAHRAIYTALTVDDAHVVMEVYLSWVLLYLGHLDRGRKRRDDALAEAHRLSHAYTLAHALNGLAFTELTLGSFQSALQRVEQLAILTAEHAISYYGAMGTVLYLATFRTWLADAYGKAKEPERGLTQLAEVAELVESTQMRVDEAEMHRVRGELLVAVNDPAAAADSFHTALTVSRRQGAKLWELCAATSFARLRHDQGDRAAALDILQPVYTSFTEGLDTPALSEAKTLLDTLA